MRLRDLKKLLIYAAAASLLGACLDNSRPRTATLRRSNNNNNNNNNNSAADSGLSQATKDANQNMMWDAQNIIPDIGNLIPDSGQTTNPPPIDAGPTQPTDCNHNPNQCVAHQLNSGPPNCTCLPACESGWTWNSSTQTCEEDCPTSIVNLYSGTPPCANSTLVCMTMCQDINCQNNCLLMDPNQTSCLNCVNQNMVSCVNRISCQSDYDAYACCIQNNCPQNPDDCAETTCAAQNQRYEQCFGATSGQCNSDLLMCFQM